MTRCVAGTKVTVLPGNPFPRHKSITVEGAHVKENVLLLTTLLGSQQPWGLSVLSHWCSKHCFLSALSKVFTPAVIAHCSWTSEWWSVEGWAGQGPVLWSVGRAGRVMLRVGQKARVAHSKWARLGICHGGHSLHGGYSLRFCPKEGHSCLY